MYYYGYKLHAVCGLSGIIHSFDLTKASVHDIHYLKDVKVDYSNCTVIGDRGYISAQAQLDLFETANIRLEVPYRCNQKEWKPTFPAFAKARKRIETLFSQLCDQFMIIRNYAKDTDGLFARIIGKISALTILQYRHYKIFCVNGNTGFRNESRIFYFIHLQNEEAYERKESSSA